MWTILLLINVVECRTSSKEVLKKAIPAKGGMPLDAEISL